MSNLSRKPAVLVTGANGEMGHGLIHALSKSGTLDVLALDIKPVDESLRPLCAACIVGDVLDARLLERLVSEFEIDVIFHLAALLSTRAEFTPKTAHEVNVQGTLNLLELAIEQSATTTRSTFSSWRSTVCARASTFARFVSPDCCLRLPFPAAARATLRRRCSTPPRRVRPMNALSAPTPASRL